MSDRKEADRRTRGMLRVPFIRRCELRFDDGSVAEGFTVNINVMGAYFAVDVLPRLGQVLTCRFPSPGKDTEVVLQGTVTWVNPRQQHPVHSLPPGFGVRLQSLGPDDRRCIEGIVDEYVSRNPHVLR